MKAVSLSHASGAAAAAGSAAEGRDSRLGEARGRALLRPGRGKCCNMEHLQRCFIETRPTATYRRQHAVCPVITTSTGKLELNLGQTHAELGDTLIWYAIRARIGQARTPRGTRLLTAACIRQGPSLPTASIPAQHSRERFRGASSGRRLRYTRWPGPASSCIAYCSRSDLLPLCRRLVSDLDTADGLLRAARLACNEEDAVVLSR